MCVVDMVLQTKCTTLTVLARLQSKPATSLAQLQRPQKLIAVETPI